MDLPLLLVVVLVSLAILIRIDRGIKLLERAVNCLESTPDRTDQDDLDIEE